MLDIIVKIQKFGTMKYKEKNITQKIPNNNILHNTNINTNNDYRKKTTNFKNLETNENSINFTICDKCIGKEGLNCGYASFITIFYFLFSSYIEEQNNNFKN